MSINPISPSSWAPALPALSGKPLGSAKGSQPRADVQDEAILSAQSRNLSAMEFGVQPGELQLPPDKLLALISSSQQDQGQA